MNSILAAAVNGGIAGVAVAAAVWLALALAPRRALNAATRYAVWWGTLAIVIVLPIAFLDSFLQHSKARPPVTLTTRVTPVNPLAPPAEGKAPVRVTPTPRREHFIIAIAAGPWPARVIAAWVLTALFMLLRLTLSYFSLERKKSRASATPAQFGASVQRVRAWLAPRRKGVRVASSQEISAPMASGPRRPAILIPSRLFNELPEEELEQIGLHEGAHLARRDDYALIVQRVIEALFAFHPVVRWIARRIDLEREIACDDFVLAATGQPLPYAVCLTRVAELTGGVRGSLAGTAAAGKNSHLSRRVEMLLDKTRHTGTRLLRLRFAVIALALAALAWAAARTPGFVVLAGPPPTATTARPAPVLEPNGAAPAPLPRVTPRPAARVSQRVTQELLIAQAPPAPQPAVPVSPAATNVVMVPVSVRNEAGADVGDLGAQDFQVFEDGVQQRVSVFRQVTEPVAIGIVLSVADTGMTQAWREALARVVARVNPVVEVSIFPSDRFFLANSDAVLGMIEGAVKQLNDAPGSREVLFVFSDVSLQNKKVLSGGDVMIFSEIVDDPAGLERAAASLTTLSATSYVLGFEGPNTPPDGKFRAFKVMVDRPSLTVRSRSGYFAVVK